MFYILIDTDKIKHHKRLILSFSSVPPISMYIGYELFICPLYILIYVSLTSSFYCLDPVSSAVSQPYKSLDWRKYNWRYVDKDVVIKLGR